MYVIIVFMLKYAHTCLVVGVLYSVPSLQCTLFISGSAEDGIDNSASGLNLKTSSDNSTPRLMLNVDDPILRGVQARRLCKINI